MKPSSERLWHTSMASFEAARRVDVLPASHRSRRLHGHSFSTRIRADLPADWIDFPGCETGKLKGLLQGAVAPLDYQFLNDILPDPTDENVARWIRDRLDVPGLMSVGIQCTNDSGVDLDVNDRAQIWRKYRFESAHRLPHVPIGHKCGRLHGHGFQIVIHAAIDASNSDLSIDYDEIDRLWKPLQAQLDHVYLNDLPGLENPTSELIAKWIWDHLRPTLTTLTWVTVYETASCGAHYDGEKYRIWKDMTMDSAVMLNGAPTSDPRRSIHGHTFTLRLHLQAILDDLFGWTVDFGDIKEIFHPIFLSLDHHPLHEAIGVGVGVSEIARHIRMQSAKAIPQLDRIDLYETAGCGALLSWSSHATGNNDELLILPEME
jgi:6-pyruvoyltetrahydropterin/6-carboxytetrahydropterin synthase